MNEELNSINSNKDEVSTNSNGTYNIIYANRKSKVLLISEIELDNISTHNNETTIFFSLFSFCISVTISLYLAGTFSDKLSTNDQGMLLYYWGTPIFFVLSFVFLFIAMYITCQKNSMIKKIKNESL